ncbi:MAG: hypothetical protein V1706_11545 [Pseudomonadota bacterium]
MFFKNSRYRKETYTVTVNPDGRRTKSVRLRRTPQTEGSFLHTIKEGERLDHLGFRYYKSPQKWWRLADAAEAFLSPLDLLGTAARHSVRIGLDHDDETGQPPWNELAASLSSLVGVEDFVFSEEVQLSEKNLGVDGETIPVAVETFHRSVLVTYNSLNLGVTDITAAIAANGFDVGLVETIGRTGKKIVIPPDGAA